MEKNLRKPSLFDYPAPLWRVWSVLGTISMIVTVIPAACFIVLFGLVPRARRIQTFFVRGWNSLTFLTARTRYEVSGVEHHNPAEPALIVSNRQSLFDIPTSLYWLGGDVRMVAKRELFRVPFFGWALAASEFIPIDRGNRNSGQKASQEIRDRIRSGIFVWVAPEGTRSHGAQMGSFKKGSFAMAIEAGVPIQPIVLLNSHEILSKKEWLFHPGVQLKVRVLPRISTDGYTIERRGELADHVRAEMQRALDEMKSAEIPKVRQRVT